MATKSKTSKSKKPAAKKTAEPKVKASEAVSKNGITQPCEGNKCHQVWTAISAAKEYSFEEIRKSLDKGISDSTIKTQRSRWLKFNGAK
jgi:hypothetical protein